VILSLAEHVVLARLESVLIGHIDQITWIPAFALFVFNPWLDRFGRLFFKQRCIFRSGWLVCPYSLNKIPTAPWAGVDRCGSGGSDVAGSGLLISG